MGNFFTQSSKVTNGAEKVGMCKFSAPFGTFEHCVKE